MNSHGQVTRWLLYNLHALLPGMGQKVMAAENSQKLALLVKSLVPQILTAHLTRLSLCISIRPLMSPLPLIEAKYKFSFISCFPSYSSGGMRATNALSKVLLACKGGSCLHLL